jgi:hypothetical protein
MSDSSKKIVKKHIKRNIAVGGGVVAMLAGTTTAIVALYPSAATQPLTMEEKVAKFKASIDYAQCRSLQTQALLQLQTYLEQNEVTAASIVVQVQELDSQINSLIVDGQNIGVPAADVYGAIQQIVKDTTGEIVVD